MNAPLHFKEELARELADHAATLPAATGRRSPVRFHPPLRRVAFTAGLAAAVAAVVTALPLLPGPHDATQATPAPQASATQESGAGIATATPRTGEGTRLDVTNADYAVKSGPGGTVAVQLFRRKGAPGLQATLRKAGVPAAVMTPSASCHATFHSDHANLKALDKVLPNDEVKRNSRGIYHVINPAAIPEGDHLVFIVTSSGPDLQMVEATLSRQVPPCLPAA
ncbi:hypothetical protein [Streptomyces sp. ITFR-6]|uniref:hypothetical protein n=1 Tax=Streptomyces sp. ITFR-6 TaxID=3075197 RepID=UPI002889E16A|nr:hypothetical protein [Streptomyces sp. ITFR-6]WNI30768.1 hypothetical protein RLT59_19765 [Streptomyces sp. ITFR-6]